MKKKVVVLAGTAKGLFLYRSDRARRSWKLEGPLLPGWEVSTLYLDARRKPRIFAGTTTYTYGATIRVSDNWGKTWQQIEDGPSYSADAETKLNRIWQIVPGHATEPGTFYAGVDEAGLFVSRDDGTSWHHVETLRNHASRAHWFPGIGGLCLHTILVDRANAQRLWLGVSAVGVFRTDDGGATWVTANEGLPQVITDTRAPDVGRCVHRIVADPARPDTLYQQFHGGVFRSRDGAATWQKIEHGLPGNFGFPMAVAADGNLFVVPLISDEVRLTARGRMRVFRSKNQGDSWRPSARGLPDEGCFTNVLRDAMAVDTLESPGVYFGTTAGQMFASTNSGDSWRQLPGALPRVLSVRAWVEE